MVSQRSRVLLSVALLAAVSGPGVPAYAATPATAPPPAGTSATHQMTTGEALAQARRTGKAVDVAGSTTATQTVTALPSGRLRMTTTLVPARRYVDGRWRALDATLKHNADGTISPAVSTSDLRLSGGGSGPLAQMATQGRTFALTLPMSLPAPALSGDTATYSGVLTDVDLVVRADRQGGFTQTFVVHTAAAAANPALASLTMRTGGDLKLTAHPDGSLDAVDPRGRSVFTAGVPIMWDSASPKTATGTRVAASDARRPGMSARRARVGVAVTGAGLNLMPDKAMLAGQDVRFPLYIDPGWTPVSPTRNNWATVSHSYPSSFYWNKTPDPQGHLQVGNSNEALLPDGIWSRSFLNFAIPVSTLQGATLNAARLTMTQTSAWNCTPSTVNIYAPSTTLTSGNASWNSWVGVSLGAVIDNPAAAHGRSGCPAAGVEFNVINAISNAVAANRTTQTFVLTGVNEATDFTSWKEFDLGSVAMTVEYNHKPDTPGAAQLTTSPATSCLNSVPLPVGLGNVSLYGQVADPDPGTILGVEFQLWRSDTPGTLVASSDPALLTVSSGSTAVLVVQGSKLIAAATGPQTEFSWKVRAKDDIVTGDWSPTCRFVFDQSTLGAPNVPEIPENTTTIGQPATLTVTKPDGSTIPSGYLVQLNGAAPTTAPADANGTATIRFTPTRHTNVLIVNSLSPGGNVGQSTQRIFVSNPGPPMPDGDLTGDGLADLLTVGGTNNLGSGLWLATGRNTSQVSPAATNIGVRGIGLGKHDNQTDYDNAIALSGHFMGSGQQDVLVYLPTGYREDGSNAGGGSIIEGRGDGSVLNPLNQATVSAGQLDFGDGSPLQLVNAGDSTGRGLAYPDLLGVVGSGALSYLDYYPNNNLVGGWGASEDRLAVAPPSGVWSDWTLASAQVSGGTSLYLWNKTSGAVYLWKGLTHTMGDSALTFTQYAVATGWNTGAGLALSAADIDSDGDADLWSVNASGSITGYLLTVTGSTASLATGTAQALTTAKHSWSLQDAPPQMGTVAVAHDAVGGDDLTGSFSTWNTGDYQFSPDVAFAGGPLSGASSIDTTADFSVSLWAKPTTLGRVLVGQGGMRGYGLKIYSDFADSSWKFAMSTSDTDINSWDTATSGANSATAGVWTQLTATYKRSTGEMRLYVNGVFAGSANHTTVWGSGPIMLGAITKYRTTFTDAYYGQMANVQIWDSVVEPVSPPSYYQPIAMKRLLDTRSGTGGISGTIPGGTVARLKVAGAGGLPATNVTAVVLAVASLGSSAAGFLSVYPDNTPRPITSNLNWPAGGLVSNTVIVPVGANGYISIYVNTATHVIADAQGYFTNDPSALGNTTYTPVKPTRFLDTRTGLGGTAGRIPAGGVKALQVGGVTVGTVTVPAGVKAVAINVAAINPSGGGYLVTYADGTPMPSPASTLQMSAAGAGVIAQTEIVPVGANGKIDIYTSDQVDLVGDVVGYFTTAATGQKYHSYALTRLLDTRVTGGPLASGATTRIPQGAGIVAQNPTLILNTAVTDTAGSGYLVVYPDGPMPSPYSSLNFAAGQTLSNMAVMGTSGGAVDVTNASSGSMQLIVDCMGYLSTY